MLAREGESRVTVTFVRHSTGQPKAADPWHPARLDVNPRGLRLGRGGRGGTGNLPWWGGRRGWGRRVELWGDCTLFLSSCEASS